MIKIVAIVSLIVVGLVMVAMHFQSPTGVEGSFAHLWNDGGWFPKGLSGFFAGFQIAVFAFVGIELVSTTAAMIRRNHCRVQLTLFRSYHYVLRLRAHCDYVRVAWQFVIREKSPFVELFVLVGLPAAASVINFVVLTSAAFA